MSNFLTQMAERAMGLKAVAVPLLHPVFAPSQLDRHALETPSMMEAPGWRTLREEHSSEPIPPRMDEGTHDFSDQVGKVWRKAPPQSNGLARDPSTGATEAARETSSGIGRGPEESEAVHPHRTPLARPSLEEVVHQLFEPREKRVAQTSARATQLVEGSAEMKAILTADQDRKPGDGLAQRLLGRSKPQRLNAEKMHFGRPSERAPDAETKLAGSRSVRPVNAETEPRIGDIHVSIGVIELKAAAPVSSAPMRLPKPAPRRAHLSLEEYLRRRRGEGQ